jgi:hypothetical protein
MKILSWNWKGLARPAAVQTLRRLIKDQSPNILFLEQMGALLLLGAQEWNLNVLLLTKIVSLLDVFLTLPIPLGLSYMFMALQTK